MPLPLENESYVTDRRISLGFTLGETAVNGTIAAYILTDSRQLADTTHSSENCVRMIGGIEGAIAVLALIAAIAVYRDRNNTDAPTIGSQESTAIEELPQETAEQVIFS